jgi:hypothetical protein
MPFDSQPAKPFQAEAEAIVARQQADRDEHMTGGVCWSAMDRRVPEVADVEEVRQRLEDQFNRHEAWRLTPAAKFVAAARELHDLGWADEIRAVGTVYHACQGVGIGKERAERALTPESLFRALRILNGINHSSARDAITALTEIAAPLVSREAA